MWYKFVKLEQGYLETTPYLLMSPFVSFVVFFWEKGKFTHLQSAFSAIKDSKYDISKGCPVHYILHTLYMISIIIGNVYNI